MAILTDQTDSVRADSSGQPSWQTEMRLAIRTFGELASALDLPTTTGPAAAATEFPVFVPRPYLQRIRPGDPSDPLLRQVLPVAEEMQPVPGFVSDPLEEQSASPAPGLLHKYPGRVLLVVNGTCAIHCRYCFRRHFPYSETPKSIAAWEPALHVIENDPSVHEVLLSGGDPLTQVDSLLDRLISRLESIPQLKRLRIHSRLPIVIPSRITAELIERLARSRLQVSLVIHANHPHEIDGTVQRQLLNLKGAGVTLLNQSVLLRGVNDQAATLIELSEQLLDGGVLPYYLHQLDPVAGAAHFQVPVEHGLGIIKAMRNALPGYAVPRYVQEIPGRQAKTVLA